MSPNDILREQFEKETGYKLPDVRDYNSFELNVKLADYYERFSGWMKSKCEELQKENTKLKGKYNHLENHANERVHDLHQQLTAQAKELEAWQAKSNRQKGDIRKVHSELDTLKRRVGEESRQPEQAIAEKVLNWFANSRVGLSSKTMAMVACGIIPDEVHHPYDPDDLSRCIVLLDMVPEVRNHFDAISDLNNKWASLIQHWDEIESAYREEDAFGWSRVKRPSKTYTMMRNVLAVCEGGGA